MSEALIAYFSMEIALHPAMPTYSGGLGILAGDMIRAAADRTLPMVAITLLHRRGYFYQTLDSDGRQTEDSVAWNVEDFLRELPQRERGDGGACGITKEKPPAKATVVKRRKAS